MFDPFESMVQHLQRTEPSPPKAAERPTMDFVYDFPSPLLTAAIEAHKEFNRLNQQHRSRIICVKDEATGKVAVFPHLIAACQALGYNSVGVVKLRCLQGYCPDKKLFFCSPDRNRPEVSFTVRELLADKPKREVRRAAHLFSFDLKTGKQRLHVSLYAACTRLSLKKKVIEDLLLGLPDAIGQERWRFEVATIQTIHAFDPTYCPNNFRFEVLKTNDPIAFINGTAEVAWGLKDRVRNTYTYSSWQRALVEAGIST